jgi:hypothetical protein
MIHIITSYSGKCHDKISRKKYTHLPVHETDRHKRSAGTHTGLITQNAGYTVWLRVGRPDDLGSIPDRSKVFLLYPLRPDRLWGPLRLLSNGYRGSFLRD